MTTTEQSAARIIALQDQVEALAHALGQALDENAKLKRQQWHEVARELAAELEDNIPPNIESPALDRFAKLGTP
jgi:hypothetical protein